MLRKYPEACEAFCLPSKGFESSRRASTGFEGLRRAVTHAVGLCIAAEGGDKASNVLRRAPTRRRTCGEGFVACRRASKQASKGLVGHGQASKGFASHRKASTGFYRHRIAPNCIDRFRQAKQCDVGPRTTRPRKASAFFERLRTIPREPLPRFDRV